MWGGEILIPTETMSALKGFVGQKFRVDERDFDNTEGTRDNFRHWAKAAGDFNPLWHDDDYARNSPWHDVIAPPSWLTSVVRPAFCIRRATPSGYDALDAEVKWELIKPVHLGDRFTITGEMIDVTEKVTRSLGSAALVTGVLNYENQAGELLARSTSKVFLYPPGASASHTAEMQPPMPTPDQDALPFEVAINRVKRQGAEPRYWDDTNIGDELTPLAKATLTEAQIVQWFIGTHKWLLHNRQDASPRTRGARHFNSDAAKTTAIPAAFDIGHQRTAWLGELLTDWMGDYGVLKEFGCRFRGLIFAGDTPTCGGKVTKKYSSSSENLVEVELWVKNQRNELKSPGSAIVALPLRGRV